MEIQVDGYRSSDENWIYAQRVSSQELPELSPEEQEVAVDLGIPLEDYARSRLAGDATRKALAQRAETVGRLVSSWLQQHGIHGEVKAVWLQTFQGKFRVEVDHGGRSVLLFVDEDVMDGILDFGSLEAQRRFERLLEANLSVREEARASMKLAGQTVTVILTEDGKHVLKLASAGLPDSHTITVSVEESEELGLWVKLARPDQMHYFLLRWDYILAVDMPSGKGKLIGLKG